MTRTRHRARLRRVVSVLAGVWPGPRWPADPPPDLDRACSALDLGVDAGEVAAAGATLGVLAGAGSFAVAFVAGTLGSVPLVAVPGVASGIGVAVGWSTGVACRRGPVVAAAVVRTRAVADAAAVVGSLARSLRVEPVPERAVRAAAGDGDGTLRRSLREHADRAAVAGAADAGLTAFAREWSEWFPALERSAALLLAAVDAEAGEDRERLLDRAVAAVEEDLRDRAAAFAGDLRGPVTGLYAFGVLLPLALVGALPAAVAAGVSVPPSAFVLAYGVVLPVALAAVGGRLLLRRPVAFPGPRVGRDHPDVPDRRGESALAGAGVAAVGWTLAAVAVGDWAAPVAAVGAGGGAALVVLLRPRRRVRRRIRERERGLPDALALLGRRVDDDDSVERALPAVAATLPGPIGEAFSAASRRREALGVTVEAALAGEGAPFDPIRGGGPRTRGAIASVAAAVTEGRPAGDAIVAQAERLDALAESERAARRELATVTGTLRDTAALFGPLVGGATVGLAARLDGMGAPGGPAGFAGAGVADGAASSATALPPALVGTTVGAYVLALAAVLTALATGLERGIDGTVVGYRVGLALVSATGAFLAGVVATRLLIG
ncbi:type II secretion system protein [Halobaculum sp. EA56]|uniref:type II secretion system protein n=1 Tax=Halobaculum sp. EA56 TaxID=3421648 RepID=UPI003EC06CEF